MEQLLPKNVSPDSKTNPSATTGERYNGQVDISTSRTTTLVLERPSEWTLDGTKRLISKHGTLIVNAVDENGDPIFWDAIKNGRYDCADTIIDYAKEKRIHVTFQRENNDLLSWGIESKSNTHVKFILDKVSEKCVTVDETCLLLNLNLSNLKARFPECLGRFLQEDKFMVEYARFSVPQSLFGNDGKSPVVMMTDYPLNSWETFDSNTAKSLWINKIKYAERLTDTTDIQVIALAKFFCIRNSYVLDIAESSTVDTLLRPGFFVLYRLSILLSSVINAFHYSRFDSNAPTSRVADLQKSVRLTKIFQSGTLYESETLTVFVDWCYDLCYNIYLVGVLLNVIGAMTFTIFALLYGRRGHDDLNIRVAAPILVSISLMTHVVGVRMYISFLRTCIYCLEFVLLLYVCITDEQTVFSAFLISVVSVLNWALFFRTFRPFSRLGPFISMVGYALNDTLPFMFLGFLLIIGYSTAFVVLFEESFVEDDEQNFNSLLRSVETLFHSSLGNFDQEMLRSASDFLGVWRALLFNSFVYIGAMILMSLLVAILTDTYDRVRMIQRRELTKRRMRALAYCRLARQITEAKFRGTFSVLYLFYMISDVLLITIRIDCSSLAFASNSYFHYLVPEDKKEESPDEEWQGRLLAVEKTIKFEVRETKANFTARFNAMGEEIEKLMVQCSEANKEMADEVAEMKSHTSRMEERMSRMETAIDQVLHKLDQLSASSN